MKLKFNRFLVLAIALISQLALAQEKNASGVVTDVSGMPLPGVNVVIKGTSVGTQTGFDGAFKIKAGSGETLVFSFLGMKTIERAAATNMSIKLQDDAVKLTDVLVTAQGIRKEKQAIGYAVSQVKSKDLEQRSEGDISRVLSGKASGLQVINGSGISGSATNINIRGNNTISGNSQPLFIVDGVPFSGQTSTNGDNNSTDNRNDFINGNSGSSSRFLDLDPNNIESVNVLKGYAAATLYGTEGRNGVILIITKGGALKKGNKKTEISVAQSIFANEIASLPDYQNKFGNGFDQAYGNFYSNWGPGFYKDGLGGYGDPLSGIGSDGTVKHPYDRPALNAVFPQFAGVRLPYTAKPDNVKNFFRTGFVYSTSINVAGGSTDGKSSVNLNFGRLEDEGFTRGNKLTRNSISIGGKSSLSNKFTVSGTLNFANTKYTAPPVARADGSGITGTGLSVYSDVFYTPRNIDLNGFPFQNPVTGQSVYYRGDDGIVNPNWTIKNSFNSQITNRVFGNAALKFEINKNMNLSYRVGIDMFIENSESGTNQGAGRGPLLGRYRTFGNLTNIWDHNISLDGRYSLTEDLNLSFNIGATTRATTSDIQGVNSVEQLSFDVFRHFNFKTQTPIQFSNRKNIDGIYGQVEFDYKKWAYLTLSERKDWVSNTFNNTIDYPSASIAIIPTTIFPNIVSEKGLNYLKLRAGYGTSAGFADLYPVVNTVSLNANGVQNDAGSTFPVASVSNTLGNPNLKPELQTEIELGLETKFLNNRVNLDFSFFKRRTKDLITDRPLPPSSGFGQTKTNIGQIDGEGLEIDLGLNVIKNSGNGFNWDINSNFTKSKSIVTDLGTDTKQIVFSGFSNKGNAAIVGEQFGVLVGSRIQRDANGNFVVLSNGRLKVDQGTNIIGNPNPDFILNVSNGFSYRNINFNFLINYTQGGDIYSETISALVGRGLTIDTEDRLNSFIIKGVKEDGSVNDIQINNSDYYFSNFPVGGGADEAAVYDATTIRLSEVSLGYTLPSKYLDKTPFGSLSFSISGNNLYYNAINTPKGVNFDPNVSGTGVGNGRGFDYISGPSSKRYGFSIKASF
jgi:TonB-linked SusC/RagA family outer membrane protein